MVNSSNETNERDEDSLGLFGDWIDLCVDTEQRSDVDVRLDSREFPVVECLVDSRKKEK